MELEKGIRDANYIPVDTGTLLEGQLNRLVDQNWEPNFDHVVKSVRNRQETPVISEGQTAINTECEEDPLYEKVNWGTSDRLEKMENALKQSKNRVLLASKSGYV